MRQWFNTHRDFIRLWWRLIVLALLVALASLFAGFLASELNDVWWRCSIGLGFAIVVGNFASPKFLRILRTDFMRFPRPKVLGRTRGVPPSVVGVFEIFIFSVAVGIFHSDKQALAGVLAAMGLWLGTKMLAGWNRDSSIVVQGKSERERKQWFDEQANGAISALLAGAFNLAIATVGGNIAANGLVVKGGACALAMIRQVVERAGASAGAG